MPVSKNRKNHKQKANQRAISRKVFKQKSDKIMEQMMSSRMNALLSGAKKDTLSFKATEQ